MTNIELLKAALVKANAIDINESPSAEMGVNGLQSLNAMMSQWALDGIQIGWYPQTDMSATVPVIDANLRAIIFNFAIELSTDGLGEISDDVRRIAGETYDALCKSSRKEFVADMTMLPQAEGMDWGQWFVNGGTL